MNTRPTPQNKRFAAFSHRYLLAAVIGLGAGVGLVSVGGCESDEAVGYTKTTEKRVIDTPAEKTTITETHEKDTKIVR